MNYENFLATKQSRRELYGFRAKFFPEKMKDFQRHLTEWSVRLGRSAGFASCGTGKSVIALTFCENIIRYKRNTGRALILCPLAVASQFEREAEKFGMKATKTQDGTLYDGINVTNYHRIDRFSPHDFDCVVTDECFSRGTKVDVVGDDNEVSSMSIEDIHPGQLILNASGVDYVKACAKRRVSRVVILRIRGEEITCSENHPFFTLSGWRSARNLRPGDYLVETGEAMRLVRKDVLSEVCLSEEAKVLRTILLGEENRTVESKNRKIPKNNEAKEEGENKEVVSIYGNWSDSCSLQCGSWGNIRTEDRILVPEEAMYKLWKDLRAKIYSKKASNVLWYFLFNQMVYESSRCQKEVYGRILREGFKRSVPVDEQWISKSKMDIKEVFGVERWKWDRIDKVSEGFVECFEGRLDSGSSRVVGNTVEKWEKRGSNYLLQNRFGEFELDGSYRVGWGQSYKTEAEGKRQEKGRKAKRIRVESVEILESGNSRLDRFRDADGSLYFYDLEATRHPSFSVNGVLVHNCAVLKGADRKWSKSITKFMSQVPYRLLCSATPAPNDYMELGSSAESLGVMKKSQMLAMFFTNDGETTQQWSLKGHAKKRFWLWVATWARAVRKPSDLDDRFSDEGYILPELRMHTHVLPSAVPSDGFLLPQIAITLDEQRAEARRTIKERCEKVAEIVTQRKDPCILWCNLNTEGDLLEKMIPNAVQVAGRHSDDVKEQRLNDFALGRIPVLVTKGKIAGWGLNLQVCHRTCLFPTHSFELFHQMIRRIWRFGQKYPVDCHVICTEGETAVLDNMMRKERQSESLYDGIVKNMMAATKVKEQNGYVQLELPEWLKT